MNIREPVTSRDDERLGSDSYLWTPSQAPTVRYCGPEHDYGQTIHDDMLRPTVLTKLPGLLRSWLLPPWHFLATILGVESGSSPMGKEASIGRGDIDQDGQES